MGKLILVTGGARSGKSVFAESLLGLEQKVTYLAAAGPAQDEETKKRIELHQSRRPQHWQTYEGYLNLARFINQSTTTAHLLDCATMLTTNYFYYLLSQEYGENYQVIDERINHFSEQEKRKLEDMLLTEWREILATIKKHSAEFVIVTNEVGLGIVPENAFTRWFRDILGSVNQLLGKEADEAYVVIAGIPVKLKC